MCDCKEVYVLAACDKDKKILSYWDGFDAWGLEEHAKAYCSLTRARKAIKVAEKDYLPKEAVEVAAFASVEPGEE